MNICAHRRRQETLMNDEDQARITTSYLENVRRSCVTRPSDCMHHFLKRPFNPLEDFKVCGLPLLDAEAMTAQTQTSERREV